MSKKTSRLDLARDTLALALRLLLCRGFAPLIGRLHSQFGIHLEINSCFVCSRQAIFACCQLQLHQLGFSHSSDLPILHMLACELVKTLTFDSHSKHWNICTNLPHPTELQTTHENTMETNAQLKCNPQGKHQGCCCHVQKYEIVRIPIQCHHTCHTRVALICTSSLAQGAWQTL